jgi:hypothetical protein
MKRIKIVIRRISNGTPDSNAAVQAYNLVKSTLQQSGWMMVNQQSHSNNGVDTITLEISSANNESQQAIFAQSMNYLGQFRWNILSLNIFDPLLSGVVYRG